LPALHWVGIRLAVCTNKQQELARAVLAHFGIAGWIETVVGADTTPHRKPHPAPLLHALDHLSVAPDEALFVGDTVIDRDCAAAASVDFRVVDWGTGPAVPALPAQRLRCFVDLLPGPI
jgi:HAD superfamily hydrolase (TIGR01549 family)